MRKGILQNGYQDVLVCANQRHDLLTIDICHDIESDVLKCLMCVVVLQNDGLAVKTLTTINKLPHSS
jgi:hypothetical protein